MMQAIVFTDLDGTLLDHDSYDWRPALPALRSLREDAIPIVVVTSKTRAEVERLQSEMQIDDPFVVENGAAVFFPPRWHRAAGEGAEDRGRYRVLVLGRQYAALRRFLEALPPDLRVQGFGDWSEEEVVRHTGLDPERARLAAQREFTEPFLAPDERVLPELERRAAAAGLAITRGGRFFHLIGAEQDKGRAVGLVAERLGDERPRPLLIALGDSPNDLPMLRRADLPIVVPHVAGTRIDPAEVGARLAPAPGPRGWNRAVLEALERLRPPSRARGGG